MAPVFGIVGGTIQFICLTVWIAWRGLRWLIVLIAVPVALGREAYRDWRRRPDEPRVPSLVLEFLKAKKRRICPLIEVVP